MTKVTYSLRETDNGGFILDANSPFPGQSGSVFAFSNAADLIRHLANEHDVSLSSISERSNAPWTFVTEEEKDFPAVDEERLMSVIWSMNGGQSEPLQARCFKQNWPGVAAYRFDAPPKLKPRRQPPAPPADRSAEGHLMPAPPVPMQYKP